MDSAGSGSSRSRLSSPSSSLRAYPEPTRRAQDDRDEHRTTRGDSVSGHLTVTVRPWPSHAMDIRKQNQIYFRNTNYSIIYITNYIVYNCCANASKQN